MTWMHKNLLKLIQKISKTNVTDLCRRHKNALSKQLMTRMAKRMTRVAAKAGVLMQMYPSSVRVCLSGAPLSSILVSLLSSLMAKVRSPDETTCGAQKIDVFTNNVHVRKTCYVGRQKGKQKQT